MATGPPAAIGIGDGTLVVSFCKVASGKERLAFSAIAHDHPTALLFKALGDYDIVAISENRFEAPRDLAVVSPAASSCQGVSAVKLCLGEQYTSPDPQAWLRGVPLAALVFLELDKWLYTLDSPMSLISALLAHVFSNQQWHHGNLSFYGGIGQSESICIVKPDECQQIFDYIRFIRQIRVDQLPSIVSDRESANLTVLSSTFSIPLIS